MFVVTWRPHASAKVSQPCAPPRQRRTGAQPAAGSLRCACVVEAEAPRPGAPPTALPVRAAGRGGAAAGPGGGGGGGAAPIGGQRAAAQEHAGGPHRAARAAPAGQAAAAAGADPARTGGPTRAPCLLRRPCAPCRPYSAAACGCSRPWVSSVCVTPRPVKAGRPRRACADVAAQRWAAWRGPPASPPGTPKRTTWLQARWPRDLERQTRRRSPLRRLARAPGRTRLRGCGAAPARWARACSARPRSTRGWRAWVGTGAWR